MRRIINILGVALFSLFIPASGASLKVGVGSSYLYPAGRLGAGLNGGAKGEVYLGFPTSRIDFGASLGYATLRGKENQRLVVILTPLELILRTRVMDLSESATIRLETGFGVSGLYRVLDPGKEGSLLGGEKITSFGLGVDLPFGRATLGLRVLYHRILDPIESADLFSLGGLILYDTGE